MQDTVKRSTAYIRATRPRAVLLLPRSPEGGYTSFSLAPSNPVYVAVVPHLAANVKAVCSRKGRALQMGFEGFPKNSGPVRLSKMHPVRNNLHTNGWQRLTMAYCRCEVRSWGRKMEMGGDKGSAREYTSSVRG